MIGAKLGTWILDKEIGRGGMGRVYLAHQEPSGKQAAVKVLAAELAQEPGFLDRFQREIDVLSVLNHPNIIRLYESGTHDGLSYYAMEYVDGVDFEHLLNEQGRIPWKEVLDAALQVCPALKHAHDQGIVHRDLKPPNLLRTQTGTVKLADFGIAKVFAARHLTSTGGVVGTAEFLSPEQAAGKPATNRSDLYSLGVVMYNLLTGRTPFEGHTTADLLHKHLYSQFDRPIKLATDMPHELDEVIGQLLEKDPARRPANAIVLQKQLDSIRRKYERRAMQTSALTIDTPTVADNRSAGAPPNGPGPATLMSQLMREELTRQKHGSDLSQWFNRPIVLLPLFLLCVGTIIWVFMRPAPATEETNNDAPDWVAQRTLKNALAEAKKSHQQSEAERVYNLGLRQCKEGELADAKRTWGSMAAVFGDDESAVSWIQLAEQGLAGLPEKVSGEDSRLVTVRSSLERIERLRKSGKEKEAQTLLQSLTNLYGNDPRAAALLQSGLKETK